MDSSSRAGKVVLAAVVLVLALSMVHPAGADRDVRVALVHLPPSIYTDEEGKPAGLFVEILRDIAEREGWNLIFVPGTLSESWERLAAGEIDLMMSISPTPEREKIYDFSHERALSVWSQVYAPPGSGINTILDLDGKRVAVLRGDVNAQIFRDYADKFGITPTLVEYDTLDELFSKTASGGADAVVAFNIAGKESADKYGLQETNILFNPTALGFAVPKGRNQDILSAIDRYIVAGKSDDASFYTRTMQKWFGMKASWTVPYYLWWGLGGVIALVVLFVVMSLVLKREVNRKTAEISRQNEELRSEIARRVVVENELLRKNEEIQAAYEEMKAIEEELRANYVELGKTRQTLTKARKKLSLLNTVTFQEIQNGIFSLNGLIALAQEVMSGTEGKKYLDKAQEMVRSLENTLRFTRNYQELGLSQPAWQDVNSVFLYAISHLDCLGISRTVQLDGLEIYADPLLEEVFYEMMKKVTQDGNNTDSVRLTYRKEKEGISILVDANGPGIPEGEKERIFEEDYIRQVGSGLFLSREILSMTGISIRETGEPGKGTRFEIFVPEGRYRFRGEERH
ncbi:MAG: transporter substrate-binding domain-containing protein [Methanolinea sp.]|nr:transporter substrate-binding domain-containing protein [Methanolinea sp.]